MTPTPELIRSLTCFLWLLPLSVFAKPTVCLQTNVGEFCIELFEQAAPGTVANFLNYVNDGDYNGSIIHRSVPGFIIQGGGFTITDDIKLNPVPTDAAIPNEFSISNTRGTVAMAKLDGDPNSATSQWFVNLADNSGNLDAQNGGFTVFGQVTEKGMDVIDAIAELQHMNFGGALAATPVVNFTGEGDIKLDNFVRVTDSSIVEDETATSAAKFQAGRLTFPVDAGIFGHLRVAMDLVAAEPLIVFQMDLNSTTSVDELPSHFAVYSVENFTLEIPSVDVDGKTKVSNVTMELTDPEKLEFTVRSLTVE